MKSRKILTLPLCTLLFALCSSTEAQQYNKIYRVGHLSNGPGIREDQEKVIQQALRELGYVEGQNLVIEWRFSKGKLNLLPDLAAELVRLKMDVIVTGGNEAVQAAKEATPSIPIVMAFSGDPVGAGFVASLARPGGNITGLSRLNIELSAKRLELLKETVLDVKRVAVLFNPEGRVPVLALREVQATAERLGLQSQSLEVRVRADIESAFRSAAREGAGGLLVLPGGFLSYHRTQVVGLAAQGGLPGVYPNSRYVEAGGLMSYASNRSEEYRRAAIYVDKILKGAKPADLPIQQPTKFELVINLKTARTLGLKIPAHILMEADKVIE
ncbi:MAG: ABC transporter substrate-binding protein [Candidatus Binatia bacterium]